MSGDTKKYLSVVWTGGRFNPAGGLSPFRVRAEAGSLFCLVCFSVKLKKTRVMTHVKMLFTSVKKNPTHIKGEVLLSLNLLSVSAIIPWFFTFGIYLALDEVAYYSFYFLYLRFMYSIKNKHWKQKYVLDITVGAMGAFFPVTFKTPNAYLFKSQSYHIFTHPKMSCTLQ